MTALQHAARRRIKDSPLEQREAELLAATDTAALLTRDQMKTWAGKEKIRHLADVVHHFDESFTFTARNYRWGFLCLSH